MIAIGILVIIALIYALDHIEDVPKPEQVRSMTIDEGLREIRKV